MDSTFGIGIPETLEEIRAPSRAALLVYDLQAGIVSQIAGGDVVVERIANAGPQRASRGAPDRLLAPLQRPAPVGRRWSAPDGEDLAARPHPLGAETTSDVRLTRGPDRRLRVAPRPGDLVLDKVTMSAFEGTPLALRLPRYPGLSSVLLAGIALEVGIEPTARHAADLGFIPVLVQDACGSGNAEAAQRSPAALRYCGDSVLTDLSSVLGALPPGQREPNTG